MVRAKAKIKGTLLQAAVVALCFYASAPAYALGIKELCAAGLSRLSRNKTVPAPPKVVETVHEIVEPESPVVEEVPVPPIVETKESFVLDYVQGKISAEEFIKNQERFPMSPEELVTTLLKGKFDVFAHLDWIKSSGLVEKFSAKFNYDEGLSTVIASQHYYYDVTNAHKIFDVFHTPHDLQKKTLESLFHLRVRTLRGSTSDYFTRFKFQSFELGPEEKFEVAKSAVISAPDWIHWMRESISLSRDEYYSLILMVAQKHNILKQYYIDELPELFKDLALSDDQQLKILSTSKTEQIRDYLDSHPAVVSKLSKKVRKALFNLAFSDGYYDSKIFLKYPTLSMKERFQIANSVTVTRMVNPSISVLNLDQSHRVQLARTWAKSMPEQIASQLHELNLTHEDQFSVLQIIFAQGGWNGRHSEKSSNKDLVKPSDFETSQTETFELARLRSENNPVLFLSAINLFSLSPSARRRLALVAFDRLAINERSLSLFDKVTSFGFSEAERFNIALRLANVAPSEIFKKIGSFGLPVDLVGKAYTEAVDAGGVSVKASVSNLAEPLKKKLLARIYWTDPIATLAELLDVDMATILAISDNQEPTDLRRFFLEVSKEHPELLPRHWIKTLWDRVYVRDTGLRILEQMIRLKIKNVPVPEDSLDVLKIATGFDTALFKAASHSSTTLGPVYALLLEIQGRRREPVFSNIRFSEDLLTERHLVHLTSLLTRLRDNLQVEGGRQETWEKMLSELGLTNRVIGKEQVTSINAAVEDKIVTSLIRIFSTLNISFNYEQFSKLKEKWGDFEPVFTLIARFQGTPELGSLAKIFKASLDDKFDEFKFEGLSGNSFDQEKAKKQLEVLETSEQKDQWKQNRINVSYFNSGDATKNATADLLNIERGQNIIRYNLIPHFQEAGFESSHIIEKLSQDIIQGVLFARQPPQITLGEIKTKILSEDIPEHELAAVMVDSLMSHLAQSQSTAEYKKVGDFLNFYLGQELEQNLSTVMADQLRADLKDLRSTFQKNDGQASGSSLVVTTLSHDPKLLLTVGDLVDAASCQNYRTGSVIRTLPGYVMDANVEVIASFSVNAKFFKSVLEYNKVVQAVRENKSYGVTFDGNKRILTFTIDGIEISTQTLGKAYLRQMVKLGDQSGTPAVVLERAYAQTHGALETMQRQHNQMLEDLAHAIGGKVLHGSMTVAGGRNPSGHYSDLAAGAQTGSYVITVP